MKRSKRKDQNPDEIILTIFHITDPVEFGVCTTVEKSVQLHKQTDVRVLCLWRRATLFLVMLVANILTHCDYNVTSVNTTVVNEENVDLNKVKHLKNVFKNAKKYENKPVNHLEDAPEIM